MANRKQTSPKIASKASKELRSSATPKKFRSAIASALAQARRKKRKK